MSSEPDARRLGRYMEQRRGGVSQEVVAALGGPSDTQQSLLETGSYAATLRSSTYAKIDKGLGWTPGSAQRVAHGGEPTAINPWPPKPEGRVRAAVGPRTEYDEGDFDALFDLWASEWTRVFLLEIDYARWRGTNNMAQVHEELLSALFRSQQVRAGEDWMPPWKQQEREEQDHAGTAPSTDAEVTSAQEAEEFGLAARRGRPDNPPDMTTGEESQDPGDEA